jgi:hypothetical protein
MRPGGRQCAPIGAAWRVLVSGPLQALCSGALSPRHFCTLGMIISNSIPSTRGQGVADQTDACWDLLRERLENEVGHWSVRDVQLNRFWRNRTARTMRNSADTYNSVTSWESIAAGLHYKDVPRSEDAVSRALKLGQIQEIVIRVKFQPHKLSRARLIISPAACGACGGVCPFLVGLLVPLASHSR